MKPACGVLFFTFFCCIISFSQTKDDYKPGKIGVADFTLPASPVVDSNTSALIIADQGFTTFEGNKSGWFSYVFKRKTRIKIVSKRAFELATVEVLLYKTDENKEELRDVSGTTYNLENGQVTETRLAKNDIFEEKKDKNHLLGKFTMPAVKEGSVIEYSYTVHSNFIFNLPEWEFQNIGYPCLWSDYQVTIPSLLVYVLHKRGVHPFFIDKAENGHATFLVTQQAEQRGMGLPDQSLSVSANTVKHRWVIKDVPPLQVENYLTTPRNYLDKIEFQLHQTYNGETATDVMNTWKKATEELLKREDFASFMSGDENNYWLDKPLESIVTVKGNSRQAARDIYYYLTQNFTCTSYYNRYISTTLQDVFKKRSGNVGELNLLLTLMLQKLHINAAPVLLSTREFGYNYPGYPVMDRLNYVICRVMIDDRPYYLDASHPRLGFGMLPGNCYNGHARIISNADSASVYFMPDSVREHKVTMVTVFNDEKENGVLGGHYSEHPGLMESYTLREKIAAKGEAAYLAEVNKWGIGTMVFSGAKIDNLSDMEKPVSIDADFVIREAGADLLYINPVLWAGYKSNPFTAAARKYPVEMNYPIDDMYLLTTDIPQGYEVEELPKAARVKYNDGEGLFEYLIQQNSENIQLRCTLKFKKATFDPEEYNSLRDFFAYVVKKESELIVFRKKK